MKLFVVVLGLAVMGCGCEQTTVIVINEGETAEAGAPFVVADGGCGVDDIVETTLPSVSMGDLLMMCTKCDVGACDEFGDPCSAYGASCDFNGSAGVCIGCCNGELGELRCSLIP